jgi:putative two-component system hydrogenase maturation factor HypX/HoxX
VTALEKRVLLLVTAFNSLTQRVFCALRDAGHCVSVEYARGDALIEEAVVLFEPDIVISPYLMQKIPESVWQNVPVIIIHPGPPGDRGPSSLDWAVMQERPEWGVTALQANDEMDAGDIWASGKFAMRRAAKASIYRREVSDTALALVEEVMQKMDDPSFSPMPQARLTDVAWHIHDPMKQADRRIDWEHDTTEEIIKKIHSADSHPGVLDEILGLPCYLYGAHFEATLRGAPKEILAKRDGAICIGTSDGALWISHLKEPGRFKLPATYVLKERLKGVKEIRIPLYVDPSLETFKEITFRRDGAVGYLGFNFYNGAMSSEQCIRLKYAIEALKDDVDLLVLTGGENFFSNGIHLTILEDSEKQGEDGWSNINAMNNLIRSILFCDDILTVASFGANAGAGGVFLGLACDLCVAREGTVLNPHYKTIGLSGSEYHTYTFPWRVGDARAQELLDAALPISANSAHAIGMIDAVLPAENYDAALQAWCRAIVEDEERYYDLLDAKRDRLEVDEMLIEQCKEEELARMHPEFWDPESDFHRLRHEFVYKICPTRAPKRLAIHRKD